MSNKINTEPDAWISFDILTNKEYIQRKPIQSMQTGVYKHTKLYAELPSLTYMLSDPQIRAIAICDGGLFHDHVNNEWCGSDSDLLKFARALLSRAQS